MKFVTSNIPIMGTFFIKCWTRFFLNGESSKNDLSEQNPKRQRHLS